MTMPTLTGTVIVHRRLSKRTTMNGPLRGGAKRAVAILDHEVKKRWPHGSPGTSTSFRSIKTQVDRRKVPRWFQVATNSGYGQVVEVGRRAGARPPPVRAIAPWVRRAGLPASAAFPIARAIGRRGIPGKFAFRDGGKAALPKINRIYQGRVRFEVRQWRRRAPRG